ncbi:TetR family transcriptional regulator [Amycolatopsis sp. OK19-0408]|uniref:TetR family transcriptional regulator n=1 Tax=Amycolatopsis iheyensis TaxID=2945988 RepID=A0A9X2NMB6_9PSEU|nr:TetR family transcriptional regulator [Amycolatopsis iheyensis]MCR6487485.1 TetR family transcriptional regulator [Amycolatopsis iheyensis]
MRPKNTPNDPERRERILRAAIELVQRSGIASVTARSVAAEAGVPVGSVAYYFESVPGLLLEASARVLHLRTGTLGERLAGTRPDNVVRRLAELIHHQLTDQRTTSIVAYELYMLGMRDPKFREVSRASNAQLRDWLAEILPPAQAAHLAAVADGYQLQCLFEEETPSVARIERVLTG